MIRTHNHNGAFSLINLICVVCMAMTGVVALTVYKCLEQIYQMQALESESQRFNMVQDIVPFIRHLPFTGVKYSGICSCSI